MYRHTTPTPIKFFLQNDFEAASRIPLIDFELEVEGIWGDYPGIRAGAGRYADLYSDGIPVGRVWATDKAVGLLHVPVPDQIQDRRESEIQHWNAAAQIRKDFHFKVPPAEAFDNVLALFDHGAIEVTDHIEAVNYHEIDQIFYKGRYDLADPEIWCEEMQ